MDKKINCWEALHCSKTKCPAHGDENKRCWLTEGTYFRGNLQGRMFGKIEMCFNCQVFKANMDVQYLADTLKVASDQLTAYRELVEKRDKELEDLSMELAVGFSEIFEALRDISLGDPTVRISEDSSLELIRKLKSMVNQTAENLGEFVDLSHEFAMGLAEHFDVMMKVSKGDLDARISGTSTVELLEALKKVTNEMIESVAGEIAERKRAKKALLKHAAELEQRNEEVKQFAYIVSHDLRAPLVNLKGFASELKTSLDEIRGPVSSMLPGLSEQERSAVSFAMDEDIPEALGFIESSVTRMDQFINAVLKLSRLGRRKLNPETIDVNQLAMGIINTIRHQIENKNAKVIIGDLHGVMADKMAMEQIMGNILTNAVLYLDPERAGKIEVSSEKGLGETVFHVRDNGRGIRQDDMHKVFAPFRRAGQPNVPGEGMGMAYVQTLIRRHGGTISCESTPDVGSEFSFSIADKFETEL